SKLDASFGHVLINQKDGTFERIKNKDSGFFVRGSVKDIDVIELGGKSHLVVTLNDQRPKLFEQR
ncbi:MAG: hypothetical protein AAGI49_10600, partial [Bacteroidota bacterium]